MAFPKRPRIERGDRLVVYASGSAAACGEGRFIAVEEVLLDTVRGTQPT